MENRGKKTKGRQKIEIKAIEKKSQQQVTFSKRRNGLIKKASELSVLCGAKVAIVGFSPGGKPFSFGHPEVNSVIDAYVGERMVEEEGTKEVEVQQEKREYENSLRKLEKEKKQRWEIEERRGEKEKGWWDESIENMGVEQLEDYVKAMEELKKNVWNNLTLMSHSPHHLPFSLNTIH